MKRFFKSFGFAWSGLVYCLPGGTNFKVQLVLGALSFLAGYVLSIHTGEWLVLIIFTVLVLSLEMLNTSVEKICDLVSKDFHPQIKIIKDVAAGAVLVSAIGSAVSGLVIFLPKILSLIKSIH